MNPQQRAPHTHDWLRAKPNIGGLEDAMCPFAVRVTLKIYLGICNEEEPPRLPTTNALQKPA